MSSPTLRPRWLLLSACALLFLAARGGAQTWTPAPAFPDAPAAREFAAGLRFGDALFALGGTPFDANLDSPVHRLDDGATAWVSAPELEGTIIHHGAGVDALGRIVIFGGLALVGDDEGQSYYWDPVEGKQGNTADRGGAAPLELFAWATDDAGRIYSLGGGPGEGATPGDPNSTWAERYVGATDAWEVLAPLPVAVADAAAVNDGQGHILVIGGFVAGGGARSSEVQRFDVATGSWSTGALPDLPVALAGARAVLGADDRVYLLGGTDASGQAQAGTWVLDLTAGRWSAGPPMAEARSGFAAALGADDHIYALGGSNAGGGTGAAERLYTPPCATFPTAPTPQQTWVGMTAQLHMDVVGGTPLSYRWRRDGVELFDGPAAGGGTLSGTDSPDLLLTGAGPADSGAYTLAATNPCGTTLSPALDLDVRSPPAVGATWSVRHLHPAGALSSVARGVDGGQVVGEAAYPHPTYSSTAHPMLWPDGDDTALDLTPPGSVGGAINAVDDGIQAGWYWWPYTTPQGTGYERHACQWSGSTASFVHLQPSGWEYGSISDTDGGRHVGGITLNDMSTNGDGALWNTPVQWALLLTPAGAWGSSATALDGDRQFGQVHLGFGVVHAAMWAGSAASFVDLNPPGSSWSYILGAGDGQQVGRATFAGVHRPLLWGGSPEATIDMLPAAATGATLNDVEHGLQVGYATVGGVSGAGLWAGGPDAFVFLHAALPAEFVSSQATDVEVDAFGTVTVSGYGYNQTTARSEALVWRTNPVPLSADTGSIDTQTGGTQTLRLFAGPEHAGRTYVVLGSYSGTSPGIPVNPWTHLPLNFDLWTELLFDNPNNAVMPNSTGTLDDLGMATATFSLPPGLALGAPLTLHHAYAVLDEQLVPRMASNAVELVLLP